MKFMWKIIREYTRINRKRSMKLGQWCIVNFINKDKMGLVIAIVNENQIQFDISKVKKN